MDKKEAPLVNGESLTPEGSPERQPCLPPPPLPPTAPPTGGGGRDDAGRRKLSAANSMDKADLAGRAGMRARMEARLRRRTGLSRVGLLLTGALLLLLLVFLIVVVVLAATWPTTPHEHLFPVCTRAACLQASAQILPKMDADAAPCNDFWRYACGRWMEDEAPPRARWSLADEQMLRHREKLRTLVTTMPYPTNPSTIHWKLQHLYESCMRLDSIESDGTRPLIKFISELGGWSILRDFPLESWNVDRTFVKIFSAQSITPYFHIGVVPDPKDSSKNIIKVTPSGLGLPDKSYYSRLPDVAVPSAYMQYLKDVITSLEARSTDAKSFGEEMFYYQRRIAEAVPNKEELEDPIASNHRISLKKLKLIASSVPMMDILQLMFPKTAIHEDTEILVPESMYLSKISTIISSSDRSLLNNYLMWTFASSYIPYLNAEVRDLENVYNRILTGAKPVERWEMCINTLEKHMGIALTALLEKEISFDERTDTKVQINFLFDHIRDAVRNSISKAYWFEKELQELTLQKINAMSLQIGISSSLMTEEYLKMYYEGLKIQRNDFFINIRNAREFELSNLDKKLMESREEYLWLDIAATGEKVTYIPAINKVIIPQWLLSPPFYNPHYPLALQYGGLGMQLAYAIVSSVLPPNILYAANGELATDNSTLVNQSAASVRRAKAFVIRDIVQNGLTNLDIANRTALSTVTHIAALRQAHEALKETLIDLPHMHQPAMESYENEHLFFLTFAQNLCSKSTPRQMDIDVTTSQHLNSSQLLPAILKELPEFSQAFSCPSTSVHYASNASPEIL